VQLAICWKPRVSGATACMSQPFNRLWRINGENASGADNQQERPGFAQWVVGFVDGEGCFSVPIFRNRSSRLGWQVQPSFSVVQGARSVDALHLLERYFGCGTVVRNARHDDHRQDMWRYGVRRLADLASRIIPFFEENPLITAKATDFQHFKSVVVMMESGFHLRADGLAHIATIAELMNRRGRSRYLESSEAIRQPSRSTSRRRYGPSLMAT
jgi:LAGLIDADG endonuclease